MHTQSEQKKAQISRNDPCFKNLRDFTFFLHYMTLHKLQKPYIFVFLQTVVTKEVKHELHKLRFFEKRERDIYRKTLLQKNYTSHCASHCAFLTFSKMLRLIELYINICNICNICNFLLYLSFSPRVIFSACFVIRCNNLQFYVIPHFVRGGMLGFVTRELYKEHTMRAKSEP